MSHIDIENVKPIEAIGAEVTEVVLKKNGRIRICFSENVTPTDIFHFAIEAKVIFFDAKNNRLYGNPIIMFKHIQHIDSLSLEMNRELVLGNKRIITIIKLGIKDVAKFYSKKGAIIAEHQIKKEGG